MSKEPSITFAAVPWALTLLGVPLAPVAPGALSTVTAVVNALPKGRKKLGKLVRKAAADFDQQCAHEGRALSATDQVAVQERLVTLLEAGNRQDLLGRALLGEPEFRAALEVDGALRRLSDDERELLTALVRHTHGLVLRFARSAGVIGVASTQALRVISAGLASRPTTDQVRRMIQRAVANELQARQLFTGARPQLAPGFVARDEMAALQEVLRQDGIATVSALHGMRGVGKSQLASAFAQDCENEGWRFVGWVTASTREQAVAELADMARVSGVSTLDDPELLARQLVTWLSSAGPQDRLLVFDNVTNPDHLKDLIPHGPGMRVLITTTRQTGSLGKVVPVGVFSEDQAIGYLEKATGRADPDGARLVSKDLGYLPVALAQAVVAMNLWGYDYARYRELLTERALDEAVKREEGDSYPDKVGAALRVAYSGVLEHLVEQVPAVGVTARQVLSALSLMAESGVPKNWLYVIGGDEQVAWEAVRELLSHSVIAESTDGETVALHRLQGQVIREDHDADVAQGEPVAVVVEIMSKAGLNQSGAHMEQWSRATLLGAQLLAIRDQAHSRVLLDDPAALHVALELIYWANELDDPYTAILMVPYVSDFERVLGADHPNTFNSRNALAYACQSAGNLSQAINLHEQNLTDRERFLGPDHPDTLGSRHNLAFAYRAAGNLSQAINLYEQNLTDRQRVLGPDHPDTRGSRNSLAHAYESAGNFSQAINLYEQTLTDSERIFGADHSDTLNSRNALAYAYQSAGNLSQAINLYEQNLTDRQRSLGPDHPFTLNSRNRLAYAYQSAGNFSQAINLYEQTLTDTERIFGADHPNTFNSRNDLATAYLAKGRRAEALQILEAALESAERLFDPTHEVTRKLANNRDKARRAIADAGE